MPTTNAAAPDLETSVRNMRVGEHYVFVIGGIGQERLTVCSQQIRALNLIYWLYGQPQQRRLGREEPGQPDLVVIGAGIAGLTAAAAAARLNKKVWVLEAHEQPLALQRGCRHRLLHPHFYEWPEPGCWKMSAGLPILDWEEAIAAEVADRIWGQFKAIAKDKGIETYTSVRVRDVKVDPPGGPLGNPHITWTNPASAPADQATSAQPPVVILAVGFGVEKTVPDLPVLSYWRDDPLDQAPLPWRTGEYTQIVSGTGDGGLVDVLRAALKDFDHVQFFSSVAAITRGSKLEDYILEEDSKLAGKTRQEAAKTLAERYKYLDEAVDQDGTSKELKEPLQRVEQLIRAHTRKNHKVIWLHQEESPWNWKSMRLNRFLISRVMHVAKKLVEPKPRTLLVSKLIDPKLSGGFSFVAYVLRPDNKVEALPAHGVTVRHGAEPALEAFPNILKLWNAQHDTREAKETVASSDHLKPEAHWENDTIFIENLKLPLSFVTPELLRVKIVRDPNPIKVKNRDVYRLIAYLPDPPPHVWRVTYDLHPSWRRRERPVTLEDTALEDAAEEPLVEQLPINSDNRGSKGESPLPFAKLFHTTTGECAKAHEFYEVRMRLNDGSETVANLVCAICREYEDEQDKNLQERADRIVKALCPKHDRPCKSDCRLTKALKKAAEGERGRRAPV
jgi:hypothetical protein